MNKFTEICYATANLSNGLVIEEIPKVNTESLKLQVSTYVLAGDGEGIVSLLRNFSEGEEISEKTEFQYFLEVNECRAELE